MRIKLFGGEYVVVDSKVVDEIPFLSSMVTMCCSSETDQQTTTQSAKS